MDCIENSANLKQGAPIDQPTARPVPHTCAQLYPAGSGSHRELFRSFWGPAAWQSRRINERRNQLYPAGSGSHRELFRSFWGPAAWQSRRINERRNLRLRKIPYCCRNECKAVYQAPAPQKTCGSCCLGTVPQFWQLRFFSCTFSLFFVLFSKLLERR